MTFTLSPDGTQLEVTTSGFTVQGLQDYLNIGDYPLLEEITLRNGAYDFDQPLTVSHGNLEIVGASEAGVTLNHTSSVAGSTLKVESSVPLPLPDYTLDAAATQGATTVRITYDAAAPLGVDDTLYISQPNDLIYIDDESASEPLRWIEPDDGNDGAPDVGHLHDDENDDGILDAGENHFPENGERLREFHSVIVGDGIDNDDNGTIDDEKTLDAVDANGDGNFDYWEVVLSDETPYAFSSAASVVRASDLVAGVEISNMTFTYDSPTLLAVDNYYSEAATGWKGVPTLDLNGTLNATVENVTIRLPESHGLSVDRSYGATLKNVTVEGAQSRTGGNGYHFVFQEAFNTTATGLESLDYLTYGGARHSLLFSAYHAEHYNHIHFGKVTRDINFHGSVDTDNFVVIENFDYSSMPGTIRVKPTPENPAVTGEVYAETSSIWNAIHRDVAAHHPHQLNPDTDGNSIADIFETLNKVWVTGTFVGGPYADLVMAMPSAEETDLRNTLQTAITGNALTASGRDGNDRMIGADGNDTLNGQNDIDSINGGAGDDRLVGESGNDTLEGDDGNDVILGGNNKDKLYGRFGDDSLDGGSGKDTLAGDEGNDTLIGGSTHDTLNGGDGNDMLDGGTGDDRIVGRAGNDSLYGGAGNDDVDGDDGKDWLYGDSGADTLDGGAGAGDAVIYAASAGAVKVNLSTGIGDFADAQGDSYTNIENVYGSDYGDTITGNASDNFLYGRGGDDEMHGSHQDDYLDGGDGDDFLRGLNHNDTLRGGKGKDTLTGGAGDDAFVFDSALGPNNVDD